MDKPDLYSMKLTSLNSPIRIDSVTLEQGGGRIGMTLCPGKLQSYTLSGDWDRDLDTDLQAIREWGASALVSLIELEEMDWYNVSDLPGKTKAIGLTHFHLPIRDMDIPDEDFEKNWVIAGERLRGLLLAGESVVLHCMAGLGRTGTIAGKLMVELGVDPDVAITRIRSARPGTIQTIFQEAYVRRCKPVIT